MHDHNHDDHTHHDHGHNHDHHDHDHDHKEVKTVSGKNLFADLKVEKLPKSEVAILGVITTKALAYFRGDALNHFKSEAELPGFRKGHVPEKIVLERVGELALLEEAGELALKNCYAQILKESGIEPLGYPQISVTKIAIGSPLEFRIKVAVFPTINLPDYKAIAKGVAVKEDVIVTDKEIEETVLSIRRMQKGLKPSETTSDEKLPELTDEMVKTLGNFTSVSDFMEKLKDNIKKEKELKAKEKNRLAIINAVIEKTNLEIPQIIIDNELDRMVSQMKDDALQRDVKIGDYLKRINKTEDDLRKEWQEDAKKRASMEIIIDAIGREEKIIAPDDEVEKEVKHLLEHYQDADPLKAASYFRHVIKNEKVFEFLEIQ